MSAKRRKRISYEEYYEKKYKGSKKVWILVVLMMSVTSAVLMVGYQRSNERQEQLLKEAASYNKTSIVNNEE